VWPGIGGEDLQPILSALTFRAARRLIILDDGPAGRDVAPGDLVGSIAETSASRNERLDRPAVGTTLEEMAVVQAVGG
jgi:hypothetical protein